MAKKVSEEYPEIYHYTTGVGLHGIIESQQLWATHILYLNDSEEFVGFFDRRLLGLLDHPVREAVRQISETPEGKERVAETGGVDAMVKGLKDELRQSMRKVSLRINEPYILALCGDRTHREHNDGLLSQWRGYGVDGGYAIGFRSKEFEDLLQAEIDAFAYQFAGFGDVDYTERPAHPERTEWEIDFEKEILEFLLTENKGMGAMGEKVTALACRHKHRGFSEEAEVRVYLVPAHDDVHELGLKAGKTMRRKRVLFRPKTGMLVPYITLFQGARLPISKIIVGPHPDKSKRVKAVQLLLKEHKVDADVVASDIPYLGL